MFNESSEITQKYLGHKGYAAFAKELGIGAARQQVFNWAKGFTRPDVMTLIRITGSDQATPAAKQWAAEMMTLLMGQVTHIIKLGDE